MPLSPERQVIALLQDVLTEEKLEIGYTSPSRTLGRAYPCDFLAAGQLQPVLAAAEQLRKGTILT